MNWWIKLSMPLPRASGVPSTNGADATIRRFNDLPQPVADNIESEHGPLSYLGHGSHGFAYQTPRSANSVVKVTNDPTEAKGSEYQMKHECPCMVKVYGVRQLGDKNYWQIVLQKVAPLSMEDQSLLERLLRFSSTSYVLTLDQIYLRDKYYFDHFVDINEMKKMYKKLMNWLACMRKHNAKCYDAVEGNFGYNPDGSLILLDLGGVSSWESK